MYNSRIIAGFKDIAAKIKQYSAFSIVVKGFAAGYKYFKEQSKNSQIIVFFKKDWKVALVWRNSLLFIPFILLKRMSNSIIEKQSIINDEKIAESTILALFRSGIKSLTTINTRSLGIILLAGVLTESSLSLFSHPIDLKGGVLRALLLLCSISFILLNRSFVSLYEGSWVLNYMLNFFKVRGIDDAVRLK